jgi:hypothetical protein
MMPFASESTTWPMVSHDETLLRFHYRMLEENNNTSNTTDTTSGSNDSAILRNTFLVYGSTLLAVFFLFCWIRLKFPRPFNTRNWVPEIQTPIARDQFGFFSWMWQLNTIMEDEFLQECGMDALCFIRLLRMGFKVACAACFNAFWLMPLYATAPTSEETQSITDRVVKLTTANLSEGSPRLIGTVIAANILFGYVMYLILHEFEWFTEKRHKYLRMPRVQNYSVYVFNIPPEYRSNKQLKRYFQQCFVSDHAVLEAKLRIKSPKLNAAVKKRDLIVEKLEHAITYEQVKNATPMHREKLSLTSEKIQSIPYYAKELQKCNEEVVSLIQTIENDTMELNAEQKPENDHQDNAFETVALATNNSWEKNPNGFLEEVNQIETTHIDPLGPSSDYGTTEHDSLVAELDSIQGHVNGSRKNSKTKLLNQGAQVLANKASSGVKILVDSTKAVASIITIPKEGEFYPAGFVTFSSLGFANAAKQMVHHDQPFTVEVSEAPCPKDSECSQVDIVRKLPTY